MNQISNERSQNVMQSCSPTEMTGAHSLSHQSRQHDHNSVDLMSPSQSDDLHPAPDSLDTVIPLSNYDNESFNQQLKYLWIQKFHPWFPILHHTSVAGDFSIPGQSIVHRAIMAATTLYVPGISLEQKICQSETIREEVYLKSITSLSLASVQALLILAFLCFGEGKWS